MSLLSDLNNKIKALSARVGTEVKSLWEGVNTAQSTATAAQTTANTAKSTADTAKSTADTANSTANTAKSTADTANSTANTANSTANTALSTANAKVSKSGDSMTGELINYLNGHANFRAVNGNYGFMIRNDGDNTWFLLTNAGDPLGAWQETYSHPMRIHNATNEVYFYNGAWLGSGKIWIA